MTRVIFHADLDAFYTSVEQLDNPELRGRPVVVGGAPETRGVVAAASYEARRFGVRSAMPMSRALRLCPDAVRVPPRFGRYGEMSRQVMAIFRALTPLVEPLSLDEAFLDVTDVPDAANPVELARWLKLRVLDGTRLTVSIGAGTNKSVAKIASDLGKPDGLVVVPPGEESAFLRALPVRALWGIGPKTGAHLERAGIRTIGDLARLDDASATRLLGSRGEFVVGMANGVDDRPVETEYERKSIGAETTFARDLPDGPELRAELGRIADEVARRLDHSGVRASTVTLKLRYANFRTVTRQTSVKLAVASSDDIARLASQLLEKLERGDAQFRLLGIQCSKLIERHDTQPSLWPDRAEDVDSENETSTAEHTGAGL